MGDKGSSFDSIASAEGFNRPESAISTPEYEAMAGHSIKLRASCRNAGGFELLAPVIMMQIEYNGHKSPWVDADRMSQLIKQIRPGLIAKIDKDFIPNSDDDNR